MALKGIMFDNDGTIVDTYNLILLSMRHATESVLGQQFDDEELMALVGTPLETQMAHFANGDEALRVELTRVYRAHNHAHHDEMVSLYDGVAEGLAKLKANGLPLGVVTSKRHGLAQRGLEIVGVWQYFDFLVGTDDCETSKPDPGPVLLGAQRLGLDPRDCMYVGDSPFDIKAGNAAGCTTLAALWGMFGEDELAKEMPDYAYASFSDFVEQALSLM